MLKSLHWESTSTLLFTHKTPWNTKQFISVVIEYRQNLEDSYVNLHCSWTQSICSICLFETIQLNLKKCFLSNKRRKCSLSYMDWPIFLGFPFILNFLWTGYKIKKHFSRIFLSCEPCRPSSEALYYLEILFVSIKFLSK